MPKARTKGQRSRAVWNNRITKPAAPAASASSSSSSAPSSQPSSAAMPVASFQRPQPRRANTAPAATTLDADDLAKRLSMVLAQERQRQSEMERKRQSWEADLIAARREQQKRPPRQQQQSTLSSAPAAAPSTATRQERPTILTAADFQDQPLPSLDEDSPLETVPPRPPMPFILNSSGYVPVYSITSAIKLNNTTLRRSSSADHARSLRRDTALDLETIEENHGSADDEGTNNINNIVNEPTLENWQLEDAKFDGSKQRERSPAGLARPTKHRTADHTSEDADGRARLRKLPTVARRPSQLGYPPEWSQVEGTHLDDSKSQTPPSLTLVRRGSERTPIYTWSPSTDVVGKPGRRRSIKDKVESYCTLHPKYTPSPSTSSSSDSGRDDVHSSDSSRSWRSSIKSSMSGSRRSSLLKSVQFWVEKQPSTERTAVERETLTDSDVSSVMTPRARKRSSLLSVFHL